MTLEIAETIHGWMTRTELRWLFETARSVGEGGTWVELGSFKGRSFFTVAMGLSPQCRLVAVDTFQPALTGCPFLPTQNWVWDHFRVVFSAVERLRPDLRLEVLRQDSTDAASGFLRESLDVVFVDADHSRPGVTRDLAAWQPRLRPGGLLCGHDYNEGFPDVVSVIDESFPERVIVPGTSIWTVRSSRGHAD